MSELDDTVVRDNPLSHLALERAISLRWTMRDILAGRTKFLPLADEDLRVLVEVGLVELHDGEAVLTDAGLAVIE
jgi:hypothetical protein